MYIAGQPGTGKTALVTSVASGLKETVGGAWEVGHVNCVGGGGSVWEKCAKALGIVLSGKVTEAKDGLIKELTERSDTSL